jgi:predicted Zn-ribbon and HTH transcriptional regulator
MNHFSHSEIARHNQYQKLKTYTKENGHCIVDKDNYPMQKWTTNQRINFRHNRLSQEKIDLLDKLGFSWNHSGKITDNWMQRYAELKAYKDKHGHTNVESSTKPLYNWTMPAVCTTCSILFEENIMTDQPISCPECSRASFIYNHCIAMPDFALEKIEKEINVYT